MVSGITPDMEKVKRRRRIMTQTHSPQQAGISNHICQSNIIQFKNEHFTEKYKTKQRTLIPSR